MLTLLKIKNIALIDHLEIQFGSGLNLLTGETGSGKSIIVDSLGSLTGERLSNDMIKQGRESAVIEGLFSVPDTPELKAIFDESGIDPGDGELIIRRELSLTGKNRIFINDQIVTQNLLKKIGPFLVGIHGQGEQDTLYDTRTHLEMLDNYAGNAGLRESTARAYHEWSSTRAALAELKHDEAEKLQLLDILRFQINEIKNAGPLAGEDTLLDEEKVRLNNVEKLSALSEDAYSLLYDNEESTVATLEKAARKVDELAEFESSLREYIDGLRSAQAVIGDLAITVRDFRGRLEFSPARLDEIENRLAQLSALKRKYGGSLESVAAHLSDAEKRLENIETAEFREEKLQKQLADLREVYTAAALKLSAEHIRSARKFEKQIEQNLEAVALEKAKFEVRIESRGHEDTAFTADGFDRAEFYFSANSGESPKPLAKVASGGEASRLMLVLKTTAKEHTGERASVFDEIDIGIGGRVAEAVGRKLKDLAAMQQVLCVTHQPQIASLADWHFVVEKQMSAGATTITVRELNAVEQIEEIARMLAGEQITEAARENARAMLGAANYGREKVQKAQK